MVSGTPLFQSVNDLNGLLNFLSVWPFSLLDKEDGFWGQRLGRPLTQNDPDALTLLHHLLENVMIRHTKAQTFLEGSLKGQSILSLPKSRNEYVGLEMTSFAERAAYAHLESTYAVKAVEAQRSTIAFEGQERSLMTHNAWLQKPTIVLNEMLRKFCISPRLVLFQTNNLTMIPVSSQGATASRQPTVCPSSSAFIELCLARYFRTARGLCRAPGDSVIPRPSMLAFSPTFSSPKAATPTSLPKQRLTSRRTR